MPKRRLAALAIAASAALMLSACAASNDAPATDSAGSSGSVAGQAAFPRTIQVPAGRGAEAAELTLESAPESIAALDYESAEVVAELGLADRLVLVPEAVTNPALGGHIDEMEQVPNTIPVAMELNAETVIALAPDLVIMSPRHGAESSIGGVLQQSGVPALLLPDVWSSVDSVTANIDLIGQATGADDEADALASQLAEGLQASDSDADSAAAESGPRVLVLTNQAGRPFITAGHAFPLEMLSLAGARSVSGELGIDITGPISAEQIVEAAPDGILLVDMNGSGDRIFAELLANPAVAALPGAQQTMLVQGRDVQALGLTSTVDGLDRLRGWVQTLEG